MKPFRILILALALSLLAHGVLLSLLSPPRTSEPPVLRVALTTTVDAAKPPGAGSRPAQAAPARTAKPQGAAAHSTAMATRSATPAPTPAPSAVPAISASVAAPTVSAAAGSAASQGPQPSGASGQSGGKASAISPARYLGDAQHPPYPERARELGEEGRVEAMVTVSADGLVQEVALLRSSGFEELDQAALELLRKGPYTPAQRAGVPMASRLKMAVPFRLAH